MAIISSYAVKMGICEDKIVKNFFSEFKYLKKSTIWSVPTCMIVTNVAKTKY